MANTATRRERYRFSVDQQAISLAEKRAPAFAPLKQKRFITPIGEYELSINDAGLAIANGEANHCLVRWSKIDAWVVDEHLFVARDTSGSTVVLPRNSLPDGAFDAVVEICDATLKGAQRTVSHKLNAQRRWASRSRKDRIIRAAGYTVSFLVLFSSLLIFVMLGVQTLS